jgi:protein-tyrosine phosphatase
LHYSGEAAFYKSAKRFYFMNILFVCTANVSRSFLAEQLFRHEAKKAGIVGVEAASAGVADLSGSPPDPKMIEHLFKQEIGFDRHAARQVDPELVQWADRILAMEQFHAEILKERYPQSVEKIALLGDYIPPGDPPVNIADPFGQSSFHYRTAISQITLAVKHLVKLLSSGY